MTDSNISDEELRFITGEVEKYQAMKEEVRQTVTKTVKTDSKNEWMERGREEVRAEFAKYMATFGVPQK
jgi:hypothetical protein